MQLVNTRILGLAGVYYFNSLKYKQSQYDNKEINKIRTRKKYLRLT